MPLLHLGLAHQQRDRRLPLLPLALDVENLQQACPVSRRRKQWFQHNGRALPLFRVVEHPFGEPDRPSMTGRQLQDLGQQIERCSRVVEAHQRKFGAAHFQLGQLLVRHQRSLVDEKVVQIPPALGSRIVPFQHPTGAQVRRIQTEDPAQDLGRMVAVIEKRLVDLDSLPQQV